MSDKLKKKKPIRSLLLAIRKLPTDIEILLAL